MPAYTHSPIHIHAKGSGHQYYNCYKDGKEPDDKSFRGGGTRRERRTENGLREPGDVYLAVPSLPSTATTSSSGNSSGGGGNYYYVDKDGNEKRRCLEYLGDFWTRVETLEIDLEKYFKTRDVPLKLIKAKEDRCTNLAIICTSISDYSYKTTPFGDVYYSPRFQDPYYTYRYVILTKGVRNEALKILKNSKNLLLTEAQIIRELEIDLSPGWEHFMVFRNRLDELILRRPVLS